ncbi:MAG: hypothetical protein ABIE36_03650 [Candidatus Diapherotrites archaeon]
MVGVLENKKRVFLEALLLTIVVFFFGILIGVAFESSKVSEINNYYVMSEISLMEVFALNSMIDSSSVSCDVLVNSNLKFADRVYNEAVLLEKYEDSGKITEGIRLAHKKYDILRTFLWINSIRTLERCGDNYSNVIYLYEYFPEDLTQKAEQNVWSKVLYDLKSEKGNKILLIPIAVDTDLTSLNSLIYKFNITDYPVVIIGEEYLIYNLESVNDLKVYFN